MAELLAAGAALGVASSIITFADVGWRIIKRVNEFIAAAGDVPAVLADIKAQLPLLIEKMDQLKGLGEERLQKIEPQSALAEAVTGCRVHVDRLEKLVNKLQPQMTDSRSRRARKGTQSVLYEDKISKILIKLEGYKTSFILYFTNISVDLDKAAQKDESYYLVPFLQVSDYIERVDLLESVKTAVQQMKEQQRRQVAVLLGMGGQGKSQLAMEYCRMARTSREFRAIFWIDASSIQSVNRGFESIASKIGGPSRTFDNIEEKIMFVKDTIEGWESRWLLVFDNYDAPSVDFNVASFFPSSSAGTILVTSRHEDSKRLGKVIRLTKMTKEESLELLLRRSENERTNESTKTGKLIVSKLGFLPLAVDQAGAFIGAQKLPLTLFLKEFDLKKGDILNYTPSLTEYKRALDDDEKETALNVFTTWEFSFQQIHKDKTGEMLRSFLTTASFFDTQDIGEDLFQGANDLDTIPSWVDVFLSEGRWDSVKYRKALAELSNLSLLNLAVDDTEQCRFYLHPLVADWLRLRTAPERRRIYTVESCSLLAELIENTDMYSCVYAFRLYLLKHVDECLKNKKAYLKLADEDARFVRILTGQFRKLLEGTARYREAMSLTQEAIPIIEYTHGKNHLSTLHTVHALAILYVELGRLTEAQEMYERALVGREKALGKDHTLTLDAVHGLAILYVELGRLTEAQEMYERVLAGCEKALGKENKSTLDTIYNMGILMEKKEDLEGARKMYERAFFGYRNLLGADNPRAIDAREQLQEISRLQHKKASKHKGFWKSLQKRLK